MRRTKTVQNMLPLQSVEKIDPQIGNDCLFVRPINEQIIFGGQNTTLDMVGKSEILVDFSKSLIKLWLCWIYFLFFRRKLDILQYRQIHKQSVCDSQH